MICLFGVLIPYPEGKNLGADRHANPSFRLLEAAGSRKNGRIVICLYCVAVFNLMGSGRNAVWHALINNETIE